MIKRDVSGRELGVGRGVVKLRRVLPWASVAAAVLGLGGCGQSHPATGPVADSDITFEKKPAPEAESPQDYSRLQEALAQVDRERMIAASEKKVGSGANAGATNGTNKDSAASGADGAAVAGDPVEAPLRPGMTTSRVTAPVASLSMRGVPSLVANGVTDVSNENASESATTMPSTAMGSMSTTGGATAAPVVAEVAPPAVVAMSEGKISLEDAMGVLRKHVAEHPTLNTALAMALLDSSEGKVPDTGMGNSLPGADQKLFSDLLTGLTGMSGSAPTASLSDRAAPLVNVAKKWEGSAELALPRIALASRVDSFGVYTPVEAKFSQGVKHTVIIYCEVANFVTKQEEGGWYATHLLQQETLITEDGLLVWRPNAEDVEDKSMNQRHDFYLVKKLTIPDDLAAGKYTLRMSVTDKNGEGNGKGMAVVNLPIEITEK